MNDCDYDCVNETEDETIDNSHLINTKTSTLKDTGLGIFAATDLNKDLFLSKYGGTNPVALEGTARAIRVLNDAAYAIATPLGIVDGRGHWTGLINHAVAKQNVNLSESGGVYTTRAIQCGEELFFDYGAGYWLYQIFRVDEEDLTPQLLAEWKTIVDGMEILTYDSMQDNNAFKVFRFKLCMHLEQRVGL